MTGTVEHLLCGLTVGGKKNPKKCKERSEGDLVNFLVSSDGSRFRKGNTISSLIVWIQGEVVGPCVL